MSNRERSGQVAEIRKVFFDMAREKGIKFPPGGFKLSIMRIDRDPLQAGLQARAISTMEQDITLLVATDQKDLPMLQNLIEKMRAEYGFLGEALSNESGNSMYGAYIVKPEFVTAMDKLNASAIERPQHPLLRWLRPFGITIRRRY